MAVDVPGEALCQLAGVEPELRQVVSVGAELGLRVGVHIRSDPVPSASIELLARGASAGEPTQLSLIEVGDLERYARAVPDLGLYDELLGCGCGAAS